MVVTQSDGYGPKSVEQSRVSRQRRMAKAFSLLEIILVIGLLSILSALAVPNLLRQLTSEKLPGSARQLRSLLSMTRAKTMLDGKRHRIRFPRNDEIDARGGSRQPIIERENEPFEDPGVFEPVLAAWARDVVLRDGIWCMEVRLGRPNLDDELVEQMQEDFRLRMQGIGDEFEPLFPPVVFDLDGTSEWATFVVTNGPEDTDDEDDLPRDAVIQVIMDGMTGLIWLQRPFAESEKEMLLENDWPPVLRRDFLTQRLLTEEDVLEIQETKVR